MRICFLTNGKLNDLAKRNLHSSGLEDGTPADLYVLTFGSIGEVCYEKEIKGESAEMEEVALFSRAVNATVVVGCYTDTKGIKRRSAIVADKGKILGVSDMTAGFDGEKYSSGAGVRLYDTSVGKIGVLVGRDVYFSELTSIIARCGGDFILSLYEELGKNTEQILLRADAFRYGLTVCMCAHGFAQVADSAGELAFASPLDVSFCSVQQIREYHLIQTRRRGFFKPQEMY